MKTAHIVGLGVVLIILFAGCKAFEEGGALSNIRILFGSKGAVNTDVWKTNESHEVLQRVPNPSVSIK